MMWDVLLQTTLPDRAGKRSIKLRYNSYPEAVNYPLGILANPSLDRSNSKGFSLIELVVVIAVLGVLISIALPKFLAITKDAQINQAKTALATIVKECMIGITRSDQNLSMQNISSANGSLSGYDLKSLGSSSLGECVKPNLAGDQVITIEAVPSVPAGQDPLAKMPSFLITHYMSNGTITRECSVQAYTEHKAGCQRDFSVNRICVSGGVNNCTQWVDVPAQSVGTW